MRHFIIVKFNEDMKVSEQIEPIKQLFNEALNIDGVDKINVHTSNSTRPNRYDIMIEMIMTKEALEIYDASEMHKRWKEEYGKYILNKAIFDCD